MCKQSKKKKSGGWTYRGSFFGSGAALASASSLMQSRAFLLPQKVRINKKNGGGDTLCSLRRPLPHFRLLRSLPTLYSLFTFTFVIVIVIIVVVVVAVAVAVIIVVVVTVVLLPFFVVGSSGFDSWRFWPFFDGGTDLRVSPLWVFLALERKLVGIVVVDQWWISGRWEFSVVGGKKGATGHF
jgi:hypothetical protein